jgi:hypothetical protein
VRIALCVANGIALNEIAFMFLGAGVRVPAPGFEHLGTLILLGSPAIVAKAIRPEQHLTILRVVTTGVLAVLIVVLHALAGATGLLLVFLAAMCLGVSRPWLDLVVALIATSSLLALVLWRRLRFLRPLVWVLPAAVAGTRVFYVNPTVLARIDEGDLHVVVEEGMRAIASDGDKRVCSTTTVVLGMLEWWHRLDTLPGRSHFVGLRLEGADLVVEMISDGSVESVLERRIRVR